MTATPIRYNARRLEVSWQSPATWPDIDNFPLKYFLRYRPLIREQWQHVSTACMCVRKPLRSISRHKWNHPTCRLWSAVCVTVSERFSRARFPQGLRIVKAHVSTIRFSGWKIRLPMYKVAALLSCTSMVYKGVIPSSWVTDPHTHTHIWIKGWWTFSLSLSLSCTLSIPILTLQHL